MRNYENVQTANARVEIRKLKNWEIEKTWGTERKVVNWEIGKTKARTKIKIRKSGESAN